MINKTNGVAMNIINKTLMSSMVLSFPMGVMAAENLSCQTLSNVMYCSDTSGALTKKASLTDAELIAQDPRWDLTGQAKKTPAPLTESELIALDPRWDLTRSTQPAQVSNEALIAMDPRWDLTGQAQIQAKAAAALQACTQAKYAYDGKMSSTESKVIMDKFDHWVYQQKLIVQGADPSNLEPLVTLSSSEFGYAAALNVTKSKAVEACKGMPVSFPVSAYQDAPPLSNSDLIALDSRWDLARGGSTATTTSVQAPVVVSAPAPLTEADLIALDSRWDLTRGGSTATTTPVQAPVVVSAPAPLTNAELIALDPRWDVTGAAQAQLAAKAAACTSAKSAYDDKMSDPNAQAVMGKFEQWTYQQRLIVQGADSRNLEPLVTLTSSEFGYAAALNVTKNQATTACQ